MLSYKPVIILIFKLLYLLSSLTKLPTSGNTNSWHIKKMHTTSNWVIARVDQCPLMSIILIFKLLHLLFPSIKLPNNSNTNQRHAGGMHSRSIKATSLVNWCSLMSRYNVMRSYDQSRDGSNLIRTILYYNSSQGWLSHPSPDLPNLTFQTIFWINLSNLLFESTFRINFSNQLFESTDAINLSAAPRACGILLF